MNMSRGELDNVLDVRDCNVEVSAVIDSEMKK